MTSTPTNDEAAQAVRSAAALCDVEEACADALLTACAATLTLSGLPATPRAAVDRASLALARIVEQTAREGAKPR